MFIKMKFQLSECVWEITLACCFSCKYCGSKGGKARENELSTEECLDVARQLTGIGCRRVNLIGGEVFMRRDWKEIVGELTGRGVSVTIITNGFLFGERVIADLLDAKVESVAVSLDAPRALHDKYRQEGSYDRAVRAIAALCENGIPATVISTLNSENVKTLDELYDILCGYPIEAWQLQACSPMGNAASAGVDFRFDFNEVISFVEKHRERAPFVVGIADNIGYHTENDPFLRGNVPDSPGFVGCRAGLTSIGIDSVGNVRGCESMYDERFIEGNLRERTLADIWEDPDSFAYNRKFTHDCLTGPCASCADAMHCAGGCRSYNFFVHGKLWESPFCPHAEEMRSKNG